MWPTKWCTERLIMRGILWKASSELSEPSSDSEYFEIISSYHEMSRFVFFFSASFFALGGTSVLFTAGCPNHRLILSVFVPASIVFPTQEWPTPTPLVRQPRRMRSHRNRAHASREIAGKVTHLSPASEFYSIHAKMNFHPHLAGWAFLC